MTRRIDCALLMLPAFGDWMTGPWTDPLVGSVHLQALPLCDGVRWDGEIQAQGCYAPQAAMALARLAPALRRFDLCVLPVSPMSLGWTRAALLAARAQLPVPLLLLTRQVSSGAVGDLLALGAADFLPQSARHEEIKAPPAALGRAHGGAVRRLGRRAAFAAAPADAWLLKARAQGFRATRNQVLAHFERSYVTGMLERFRGNVTHAAQAGQQDRRAFWQLMRKHSILSADYRRPAAAAEAQGVGVDAGPLPGWNRAVGIRPLQRHPERIDPLKCPG